MIQKETQNFIYSIDEETFVLKVWDKNMPEQTAPFLEQPFNPETGETFTSIEDAELFFVSRYGEAPIEE